MSKGNITVKQYKTDEELNNNKIINEIINRINVLEEKGNEFGQNRDQIISILIKLENSMQIPMKDIETSNQNKVKILEDQINQFQKTIKYQQTENINQKEEIKILKKKIEEMKEEEEKKEKMIEELKKRLKEINNNSQDEMTEIINRMKKEREEMSITLQRMKNENEALKLEEEKLLQSRKRLIRPFEEDKEINKFIKSSEFTQNQRNSNYIEIDSEEQLF
ncbi:hypothetical protein EHI8A_037220 [Entamoeba histolytica HM-1:IMSS-B]|uniref:Uncharacterized protein n=6 Tax=Entamoeba histolytica TaxID=5759 RepID=B1N3E6_ENTH1|nr:hypothetical protein EHI_165230 [Entamoeba histolytica HM-1:IMSS]EMD42413.1 Hypothetical protein EHI5A_069560 [Entamoeba histolytica KU27]EMH77757.1 hypothetical protein EHI8A_037220 [Entamoeba histolytica HM-1:IMSS-B]ENY60118.1 hypothetical protein EHI7A_038210 [Entamoeba histolytica HM-1:IMSS-A]GAT95278.1 hypothetical protein CL6EHI_165230 [Entamoeba histolytica]EDS89512.1 hypothetical protein EHI_165230 [Entamoeba histolytica HM-1:IMSS]|eukprot:XP_001913712.1 hypothetical protein EHI_165230 [Entamoeba histolytica HM-1:IMSS]